MVELTDNALKILKQRYLMKDEIGNIIETPEEMFKRVAKNISEADLKYNISEKKIREYAKKFFNMYPNLTEEDIVAVSLKYILLAFDISKERAKNIIDTIK